MKTLVINDLHLGVQRTGGTTQASAAALREFAQEQFAKLLATGPSHGCDRVIINGDLADAYDIPLIEALSIYETLDAFLTLHPTSQVYVALGNHDLSKSSDKLGSVAFVGALLSLKHKNFNLIDTSYMVAIDICVIPHVANQDLFDLELSKVPQTAKFLLVHANYDNKFAAEAEHSLNLSRDQAKALKARGITTIFGHEHQGRQSLGGSVVIVGNQFPTSVSDCLTHGDGQKDGKKRALIIDHTAGTTEFIETWNPNQDDGWYAAIDWRELKDVEEEGRGFVRVEGHAEPEDAAEVIKAISAFRSKSKSFVVTNAVKIAQKDAPDDVSASVEEIKSLSVLDLLFAELTEPQRAKVRELLEGEA